MSEKISLDSSEFCHENFSWGFLLGRGNGTNCIS